MRFTKKRVYLAAVLAIFISIFIVLVFPFTFSSSVTSSDWDGVVANDFTSGTGTEENPYVISSAGEFAYFKSLLESDDASIYSDKVYQITKSFNYGNYEISINNKVPFTGKIDGLGNDISNARMTTSLFNELENAEISNLVFSSIKYVLNNSNSALLANKSTSSEFNRIIINAKSSISSDSSFGGFIYEDIGGTFDNIIVNNQIISSSDDVYTVMNTSSESNINSLLVRNDTYDEIKNDESTISTIGHFYIQASKIVLESGTLNDFSTEKYRVTTNKTNFIITDRIIKRSTKSINRSASLSYTEHDSGADGTTIHINDLDADWNYYYGLNYASSSNGTVPTGTNRNIYNKSNLVKVMIAYSAVDESTSFAGKVSSTENYTKLIYYKWIPVVNNRVTITLIDNPFTYRPNNKAFNNWVSDVDGVSLSFDYGVYERYATVSVTSDGNGGYQPLALSFHASWTDAKVSEVTSGSSWTTVFNGLYSVGLQQLKTTNRVYDYTSINVNGLYLQHTADYWDRYTGYIVQNNRITSVNNQRCYTSSGCIYYTQITTNQMYNPDTTYFYNNNNRSFNVVDDSYLESIGAPYTDVPIYSSSSNMGGFYIARSYSNGAPYSGVYNLSGNLVSGTCNNSCTFYEFLQSFDEYGDIYAFDSDEDYYYRVTRDTNIAHLSGNITGTWSTGQNKPFTFTGLLNGTQSNSIWTVSGYNVTVYNDTAIENMKIDGGLALNARDPSNSTSYPSLIANYKNLKVGRGITRNGSNANFDNFLGGNGATGTSGSTGSTKFNMVIESGFYSGGSITLAKGVSSSTNMYVIANAVYGNDIDRVLGNNNNLIVNEAASAAYAGNVRSSQEIGVNLIVKSGSFGYAKNDMYSGIYVGGQAGAKLYTALSTKVEGGYIYNLIGGPSYGTASSTTNLIYMYQTGGTIDLVIAGAGYSPTYGNRIVSLTGGNVTYSVFGGSNGSGNDSSNGDGTVNGSSFIYVGGESIIGDNSIINSNPPGTLYGAESGSVFGNGNGKTGTNYTNIGSNDNAYIIIDGDAEIRNNVYGGGNFGIAGASSSSNSTTVDIKILGGTVNHNVYGGGNRQGAGTNNIEANVTITMSGGEVKGSVYGGPNVSGYIRGNASVNVTGGTVLNNVYGGGEGNSTFVTKNASVVIGDSVANQPSISGSVYGGSAFGTVNAATTNGSATGNTTVTVNNGVITGSVFGGGQGSSSYTPYVLGNITVTINGGDITSVYGGNDQAGSHTALNRVYLNGGTIGSVFGGGNRSSVTTTNVYLQGSDVTTLYGGSNTLGDVTTANVTLSDGTVGNAYGGNNEGGTTGTTNVLVQGTASVTSSIFGGGNQVNTTTTNINLTSNSGTIPNVYGGGNNASVGTVTIAQNGATVGNLFGGSNSSGNVTTATINHNSGTSENVYGGNNAGGTTSTSTISYVSGTTTSIYGGGNVASHGTTQINVTNGDITNVFGGGNNAGVTSTAVNIGNQNTTSLDIDNVYGGSNAGGSVPSSTITITTGEIDNIYGGNNLGGTLTNPNITVNGGTIGNIYGGGNQATANGNVSLTFNSGTATNIFGAGNLAPVTGNVVLNVNGGTISNNIYGGGNEGVVNGNTTVTLKNTTVGSKAFAGGNGSSAVVKGNTTINVGANVVVGSSSSTGLDGSVFGSGNQAPTGEENVDTSVATVNITGGTIYGNVYGGANTSVVYGTVVLNIGTSTINNSALTTNLGQSDITIRGTIFGGGESNAEGSESFDYNAISVTQGIDIKIDASGYNNFNTYGSIFGSGNASNTPANKPSTILIKNYGSISNPHSNASIQRVKNLIIDNSSIELSGVRDSTDDYHPNELFSLNRIEQLIIRNNSSLFLRKGTNYLEEFNSQTSTGAKASVTIASDGTVTKNVDNRIYTIEGGHVNVAHDGSATDYANVYGMTFFGMYTISVSGRIGMKMYDPSIENGDPITWGDVSNSGSYVLGKHEANHNIEVDGFYSNFMDEENLVNVVKYIEPTPAASPYYYWTIGENVTEYNIDLVASKYATLGTVELSLRGLEAANTSFQVLGFDYSELADGVNLINHSSIRGLASSETIANTTFGLSMETGNVGWLSTGSTSFFNSNNPSYSGMDYYVGDNTNDAPSFLFYLYHYKNLTETSDLGKVTIQLMAITQIDDINSELQRIVITIDLSTAVYTTSEYEGAMTPGKKYDLFTSTTTKITDNSSFSAYYSLYSANTNLYRSGYKHVLTSNYVFPENTKLTLIDLSLSEPKYYYYIVSSQDVIDATSELNTYHEVSYPLSKFIMMDTISNNTYNDATMNQLYYNSQTGSLEEFIVQVDFADAEILSNQLNKYLYPELQDANGNLIISALAIERPSLQFSVYVGANSTISVDAELSSNTLYDGNNALLQVDSTFTNNQLLSETIYDTTYFDDNLGLLIYLTKTVEDENENLIQEKVSGNALLGSYFTINGVNYYPNAAGETRLKFADRVGNIRAYITFNLTNAQIATGDYKINIEIFGSSDGIHFSNDSNKVSAIETIDTTIILSGYGLKATINDDSTVIVNDGSDKVLSGQIQYTSYLTNPNIRLRMYRRQYDAIYSTAYELVDLQDYVLDELVETTATHSYLLIQNPVQTNSYSINLKKQGMLTGTYRLDFELYDNNSYIGKHSIYVVIKNEHYGSS